MVDRVLVGTEGSEVAQNAVSTALRLARVADAELRAVHALEAPSTASLDPQLGKRISEQRREAGESLLAGVGERAAKLDVPTTTVVGDDPPAQLILEQSAKWGADLIAIGAQGDSGLSRAVRGSVADQLIRASPVPVLTVHQPPHVDPLDPIERIVLPSDGSEAAFQAAPFAFDLAEETGARIDLLYAVPPELEEGTHLDGSASELEQAHRRLADQALGPIERQAKHAEVRCERFVRHDAPHRAIVEHVDETDTDLVTMATQGRGRLERVLLGSVTDKVLRTSNVPVVTVAPREDREPTTDP